jgi:vacuolar-type H+-ATPase subunit E/Vma4
MADQIKELIEKINQEGVQAADEKARQIEAQAKAQAEMILQKANSQAKNILEDMLLALRSQVNQTLQNIISAEVSASLNPEELAKIIEGLVKEYSARDNKGAIVYLSAEDKNKVENLFLHKLKDELKKGIELRSQDDIRSGFIISFDAGKSSFDFSDKALVEYMGFSLKAKVAELLKDTR